MTPLPQWSNASKRGQSDAPGQCGHAYLWGFGFADSGEVTIGTPSLPEENDF